MNTQTAAQSQWLKATLDQESTNFFAFVKAEIDATSAAVAGEGEDELTINDPFSPQKTVVFQTMLPPTQHTKIVAAQAFHHVLALATKAVLSIQQEVGYGPIHLGIMAML